jgi:hypothetical protein
MVMKFAQAPVSVFSVAYDERDVGVVAAFLEDY